MNIPNPTLVCNLYECKIPKIKIKRNYIISSYKNMTSKLYSRNMHFIYAMRYNFNTNKDFTRYWEMALIICT